MAHYLFSLAALALLLVSCNFGPQEAGDPAPPAMNLPDDRLVEFAQALEEELNLGTGEVFDASFDHAAFFARIVWPQTPKSSETAEFMQGINSASEGEGLGGRIVQQIQNAGQVAFLRVFRDSAGTRLLYRFVGEDETLNYIELLVGESAAKEPVVVDMYYASTGEHLSRTLRRVYYQNGTGMLARLLDKGGKGGKTIEAAEEIGRLKALAQYEEALEYFNTLPEDVRREKYLQLLHIQIAMEVGDDERYAAAMKEMKDLYPDDPGLDLLYLDYYHIREQHDSVLAAYDRLDKRVQDPYLNYMRALAHIRKGEPKRAEELAESVIRWDSTLIQPYYVLITVELNEKDNAGIAAALERMQRSGTGTINFESLETDTTYADFARSGEYAALKRKYE